MKAKTIKKILNAKHHLFVESITDERVRELVKNNSIITGGSIVSMLLGEKINDFDYYFTNKETALAVANYYVEQFNQQTGRSLRVEELQERIRIFIPSEGVAEEVATELSEEEDELDVSEDDTLAKFRPIFISANAITLSDKVQLVIRFYGDAAEIHKNYDFVHATCYWESATNELTLSAKALEAILTRELVYQGSKYPLASIIRTRKFIERGWRVNAGQYLKMVFQLNELNLLDMDVLYEQLTGVDALYFHQVINVLKEKQESEGGLLKLDSTYLCEVVDRIFG